MIAPILGYYGKLPVSREFLRLHAAGPEVRELDEWLQQGVEYAKVQAGPAWPGQLARADIWNFLFVPGGNGRAVCGAMFASRDAAGRSFPFFTFLLLERGDLLLAPCLIPRSCHAFLTETRQLLHQLRADLDWNAFRANVESLPVAIDTDASVALGFDTYLSHTTMRGFWDGMSSAADLSQPDELGQTPVTVAAGEPRGMGGGSGLTLPLLKEGTDESYDLPFWLDLHARLRKVPQGTMPALFVFWSRTSTQVAPCALLSFSPSSPNLTRFILSPGVHDASWRNWTPPGIAPGPAGDLPNPSMEVTSPEDLPLKRYLDLVI